jgi:uncharacterized membrane protein YjjP (DUF1212 family)
LTLPTFIFGSFFALLIGSLFHLVFGGDFKRLLLYLFISWLGFWVGDFISKQIGLRFITVGLLNLGFSIIGSLAFLFIAFWLGMDNSRKINKNQ